MATDDLSVSISGSALSLLLYENRRIHDQIGFLLGEISNHLHKTVSDSTSVTKLIKYEINIKSLNVYPVSNLFFNSLGQIDEGILKNFLKDNIDKVVGWYHYHENNLKPTLRDKILHCELANFFSKTNKMKLKENFLFFLLSSSISEFGGTHKFMHYILRYQKSERKDNYKFVPVTLKIKNLVDGTRSNGTDYKPTPLASSYASDPFDCIYDSVKDDLNNTIDIGSVKLIQKAAENHLEKLILEVNKYDKLISNLEEELSQLRKENEMKRFKEILCQINITKAETETKNNLKKESYVPSDSSDSPTMIPKSYSAALSSCKFVSSPSKNETNIEDNTDTHSLQKQNKPLKDTNTSQ